MARQATVPPTALQATDLISESTCRHPVWPVPKDRPISFWPNISNPAGSATDLAFHFWATKSIEATSPKKAG